MPGLKTETFGVGDQSWLGSTHGIGNARSEKLDISTFTAGTHYPNGYIPSGLPVAKVGGVLVPYDATEGTVTGAGILAGFVLADVRVNGGEDLNVALIDHGRVKTSRLPVAFSAPAAAAKRSATTIVFI